MARTRSPSFELEKFSKLTDDSLQQIFYCVGLSSPSLIQWLEENDLLEHMNKNLSGR